MTTIYRECSTRTLKRLLCFVASISGTITVYISSSTRVMVDCLIETSYHVHTRLNFQLVDTMVQTQLLLKAYKTSQSFNKYWGTQNSLTQVLFVCKVHWSLMRVFERESKHSITTHDYFRRNPMYCMYMYWTENRANRSIILSNLHLTISVLFTFYIY